jgi:hypothetical protein
LIFHLQLPHFVIEAIDFVLKIFDCGAVVFIAAIGCSLFQRLYDLFEFSNVLLLGLENLEVVKFSELAPEFRTIPA